MGSTKYITSMGALSRKDNSICFRKDGKNIYIPIENTKEIYCFGEVSLNSKLLDFLGKENVVVHFFNYYEGYSGTFYPREQYMSGKLLIEQVHAFEQKRLKIARSIVIGIGENIYYTLEHYQKHGKSQVGEVMHYIRHELHGQVQKCKDIPELMQVEGDLWYRFYNTFSIFLPEEFVLNKRVKRPPDNPINALISFGNSLLYAKTTTTIYHTHLDQRISFLHTPAERRFSLSLDISEVFKPIITFKTIFDLVNRKRLKVDKHFEKNLNYCLLNEIGRNIFIEAFEERLESTFEHAKLHRKVSYRQAIKLDCYKLIKEILEDKPFIPFNIGEKQ